MKEYVTDLKHSKLLKEAGIVKKSKYCWYYFDKKRNPTSGSHWDSRKRCISGVPYAYDGFINAYLTDELTAETPIIVGYDLKMICETTDCGDKYYTVFYQDAFSDYLDSRDFCDEKLPNALAKMIIWLMKEGYMKWKH